MITMPCFITGALEKSPTPREQIVGNSELKMLKSIPMVVKFFGAGNWESGDSLRRKAFHGVVINATS